VLVFLGVSQHTFLQALLISVVVAAALFAHLPPVQHLEQSLQSSMHPLTQHFAQSTQQHE
jgi:hypothetical protein